MSNWGKSRKIKRYAWVLLLLFLFAVAIYYYYPIDKIPQTTNIDRLLVQKQKHQLLAFAKGKLIVTYKISIGRMPFGKKQTEGDEKTPEGFYSINSKNAHSEFHKSLGISYPNPQDLEQCRLIGRPAGGDIKIHGLKNGQGFFRKFQRWRDWTNGCIAVTDEEIDELFAHISIGIPIEISK